VVTEEVGFEPTASSLLLLKKILPTPKRVMTMNKLKMIASNMGGILFSQTISKIRDVLM
jgi:hypothetical protein